MSANGRPKGPDLKNDAKPSLIQNTSYTMQLSNSDANSNGFDAVTLHCSGFNSVENKKTGREDNFPSNRNHITESQSEHSPPKINDNATGTGVLRYALQLRICCPLPKKCSRSVQKCQTNSLSEPAMKNMSVEVERRFYLYNDLRVVFPQRHTDADEGKVLYIYIHAYVRTYKHTYIHLRIGLGSNILSVLLDMYSKNPPLYFVLAKF